MHINHVDIAIIIAFIVGFISLSLCRLTPVGKRDERYNDTGERR